MLDQIRHLLRTGDSFIAIEEIQRTGSPLEIAVRFHSVMKDLYWKAHDLPGLILIGRAGILFCISHSLVAGESPESIEKLRSTAKAITFDIGSFTWPGWEEPGINPTHADLAVGLDCARLNLRLAIELKKPADRLSMAHWLLGAQALATRDHQLAQTQFQLAQDVLPSNDPATLKLQPLNLGYLAIARLMENPNDAVAQTQFDQITGQLTADSSEDAKSYLTQLDSARRLFVRPDAKF
jgi:hypothetical protein